MRKILATGLFGLICFFSGVITQYLLPVSSIDSHTDCEEISISESEQKPSNQPKNQELTRQEIENYARKITVKVFSGHNSGSGILIHQQGNIYQVITNDHVLLFGKQNQSYKIKTPDGKIYPATIANQYKFPQKDLGILEFKSQEKYKIVQLFPLPFPSISETVYAAGFPYQSDTSADDNFTFTTGTVDLITDLSFRGGYQIGSSNDVRQGMSGGPLFNAQGKIIGINGRHKYPAWGNPYIFEDGTVASTEQKEVMSESSWAIPIQTFLQFAPEFVSNSKFNLSNLP